MLSAASLAVTAAAVALAGVVNALDPTPISLMAGDWLGIDGNWSTAQFLLGSKSDLVNVIVSTGLSEFWAVGGGGCAGDELTCSNARGGLYSPTKSAHWSALGIYELGPQYLGIRANGQYGLDTINAYSPVNDIGFGMSNVLMSAINTTDPFLGMFGLGIQQASFNNRTIAESPMTQAVKSFGWIPSYTYGFTAGAHYRGTVLSATLGGFDIKRFVSHDNRFTLDPKEGIPRPLVRGIQVAVNNVDDKPKHWSSMTEILSDWSSSFTAIVDSSTPHLWLPEEVCNRFVHALNITYNDTYGLYTLTNDQYRSFTSKDAVQFTFSLTSYDNHDNFGLPLQVPGVVNITLPLKAFVSLLEYPYHSQIKYGDPAVPYFNLKRTKGKTFILGRSFLQEAYLITRFDSAAYSIHQARFPAEGDAELQAVKQPNNSPYPGPPPPKTEGLSTGQMVGIAVGVVLLCVVMISALCLYCRRRKRLRKAKAADETEGKDSASTLASDSPRTPVSRIFSKIARRAKSRRVARGNEQDAQVPFEAPDCQIYELPAPVPPVELDGGSDESSDFGETELGTDNTENLSAYELARRKLDRQLQGPVPAYSPPDDGAMLSPEKSIPDLRPAEIHFVTDQPSPISPTRSRGGDSNTLPGSEPSPVSPRADWNGSEPPSPVTASLPPRSSSKGTRSGVGKTESVTSGTHRSRSTISTVPATPAADSQPIPSTSIQRTPIDPSRVICLGPLPENIQARRSHPIPRIVGSDGRSIPLSMFNTTSMPSEGSLGSNYTEEEERYVEEMTRQTGPSQARPYHASHQPSRRNEDQRTTLPSHPEETVQAKSTAHSDSSSIRPRLDPGRDLIHVPQMAEKRYSWEHD
ncbi:hypothetical protein JDV02_007888 [Purpureocillium takamizusanense]|uniref:Peptidase A1 domain-containing protein n=1 Tax=Purpureocillium takamizusanense TaxID=2060973 RepID=A0A9Q8VEJ2_9HYPO|nr:uncharacterized protein JDV02_007888 [Purpureocillium takamizusanense]UNI21949.1 hypothetical protein JDV02_007888 [Purpureocillium takamizusanense]